MEKTERRREKGRREEEGACIDTENGGEGSARWLTDKSEILSSEQMKAQKRWHVISSKTVNRVLIANRYRHRETIIKSIS